MLYGHGVIMRVLDLFSGIGGFSLGLERAGMQTIAFCEFNKHAQKVLRKHWPDVPIYDDVRTLDATKFKGTVDIVCGGFPCQDLSQAGLQSGFGGERSSLYREMLRIVSECRPKYAIFENVPGLLAGDQGRWFAQFLYDLAEIGLDVEWHCIEAGYIGAPHRRDRVWIIAYPSYEHDWGGDKEAVQRQKPESGNSSGKIKMATNPNGKRRQGVAKVSESLQQQIELMRSSEIITRRFNLSEPPLCGTDDGVPRRLDRIRRLGNAVVPAIPEAIGRALMAL